MRTTKHTCPRQRRARALHSPWSRSTGGTRLVHLLNLDLACYDREYASADERAAARAAHLRAWPDAIDGAIESLDSIPAPVAGALLPAVRGLGGGPRVGDDDAPAPRPRPG